MHIHLPPSSCCPSTPWVWPCDDELERLRRLERETRNEEEKRRIRDILRRRGVSEDVIRGRPPFWTPFPVGVHRVPCAPTLQDVLGLIPGR